MQQPELCCSTYFCSGASGLHRRLYLHSICLQCSKSKTLQCMHTRMWTCLRDLWTHLKLQPCGLTEWLGAHLFEPNTNRSSNISKYSSRQYGEAINPPLFQGVFTSEVHIINHEDTGREPRCNDGMSQLWLLNAWKAYAFTVWVASWIW